MSNPGCVVALHLVTGLNIGNVVAGEVSDLATLLGSALLEVLLRSPGQARAHTDTYNFESATALHQAGGRA